MSDLLIRNVDWLVTVDKDRRVMKDGAIRVRNGRIEAVGKSAELGSDATKVIDGRDLIAVPGLIDTSVAVIQQLGRGIGDFCDIPKYRYERVAAYEAALEPEDARWAARSCLTEMIRAGTTCFVDTGSRFPIEIATVAAEMGVRGLIGRSCQDVFETAMGSFPESCVRETTEQVLQRAADAITAIREQGNARVRASIAVPWLTACSDALGKGLARLAETTGATVVAGACASRDEAVHSRMHYRKTEVRRLADMGLLGPGTIVSHAGWTSPDDLRMLRDSEATIACCPSMSHRLGTGALENGRYPELLAFGANITLGSGSAMASNFVDVARQLYLFAGGSKTFRLDATVTPPETTIEMATIRAARALGLEGEIGSIEVGKAADITLFRCLAADWVPVIHPLQNLVFSARGGADTTIVDGRVLLERGALLAIDETRVLAQCQQRAEATCMRAGLGSYAVPAWPIH
jgi:cytosine/adenosine deaminase-related metal-dependent hydrolase